ncbi:hypothetical protein [Hymenobacter yonginensis]|uniref:Uncharacterized protein n=1 Tax=Hymenobacter yonginensis TaxID=748197 RepID=A0ABY7PQ30_9BACT|nr:hypothetical protein [Hymenobacter yonginensis]WBO84819.1 hypothetical protein O9Z63_00930 [Hymenobacter yonginensis]
MKKLLRIPALLILLAVGSLLTSCVASAPAVVAGPPRPYYDSYYRVAPRPYYRPARVVVRPAPVIVRPRPVIVRPAPRYYHARPYRGHIRY